VSITYEANLNCDGADCKTRPIVRHHENPAIAKRIVLQGGRHNDWVTIEDEHYCPNCAEIWTAKNPNLMTALKKSIKKEEAR